MTLKEIVQKYLEDNGFDGLFNDDCGCAKDDLWPCDAPHGDCEPGHLTPCTCGERCDFHIGPKEEKP